MQPLLFYFIFTGTFIMQHKQRMDHTPFSMLSSGGNLHLQIKTWQFNYYYYYIISRAAQK